MRLPRSHLLAWGLSMAAVGLFGCGGQAASMPASAPSPLSGKPLPSFKRTTLSGESLDTKTLVGRVVVVKFFADYCAPCKKTLPAAQELAREHPDVTFIGVSEDERASTAAELVRRYSLTFPVVHDSGQVLSGRFRISEMPATFVAGRDGVVRWVGGENQGEDALRDAIELVKK
ncbi:MAG: putative conserved lipoprotein DsbF [Polyangiaceae bacterium]